MLEELLARWITQQRWFAGKGRPLDSLTVDSDVTLGEGLRHLIISVWQGGSRDRYQLLLGARTELPERLAHALIGLAGDTHVYDAAHDPDLTRVLLEGMAAGQDANGVRFAHLPGAEIDTSLRSLVLGAEQSNTSLVYGDAYICKLFRRLIPGLNPELEIVTALASREAPHIARPYGWISTDLDGTDTTLAIMQEFLSTANDGWGLALTSVRDLYGSLPEVCADQAGGDFAAESHRLGAATARVHQELAAAFPTDVAEPAEVRAMAEEFRRRLGRAAAEVPALRENAQVAERAFQAVEELPGAVRVQRIHGDYHLGQVMRTPTDWIVLDFEGEPGQPLAERRALYSPLRDVAGMLRSFDYAPRHLLADHPDPKPLEPRAAEWATRNKQAFLDGY
ncbi:MAG: phosphotransferase, partial [Nonomuraea sp.]|nr:phosphotransferase [Nonomuraea sp.]